MSQLVTELKHKGMVRVLLYGTGREGGQRVWVPRAVATEIQDRGLGLILEDGR